MFWLEVRSSASVHFHSVFLQAMRDRDLMQRRHSTGERIQHLECLEKQADFQTKLGPQPQTRVRPALVRVGGRLRAVWETESQEQDENTVGRRSNPRISTSAQGRKDLSTAEPTRSSENSRAKGRTDSTPSACATRQALRDVDVQARCEALYLEAESRRQRREEAEREKLRQEEELEEAPRPPVRLAWAQRWAEEKFETHFEKQRSLEAQRIREAGRREQRAMRECYFQPRLVSRPQSSRQAGSTAQRLSELALQQRLCVERLGKIDLEDARGEAEHRAACHAAARTGALEASRGHVAELLSSEKGRLALLARAREYTSASPGIPSPLAVREASLDVVQVSEAAAAVSSLEEQRAAEVRCSRLRRLRVIHELIQLDEEARALAPEAVAPEAAPRQRRSTGALGPDARCRSSRAAFDEALLARTLACEPWFAETGALGAPADVSCTEPAHWAPGAELEPRATAWPAQGTESPREAFGMPLPPMQFCALLPPPMPVVWQDSAG